MICSSQHKPVEAPDISEPRLPESSTVIAAYKAVEANETSLTEGMVVRVLCKTPTGKPICMMLHCTEHDSFGSSLSRNTATGTRVINFIMKLYTT